jgi:hypothetical protein
MRSMKKKQISYHSLAVVEREGFGCGLFIFVIESAC